MSSLQMMKGLVKVPSLRPSRLLPRLGKRKRVLSGIPAQAAYAKHAKVLALAPDVKEEHKAAEPPKKIVKYYQAGPVTKRRRGFFSEPTAREVKQAQEDAIRGKPGHSKEVEQSIRHEGQPDADHSKTEGVFRNVIHELKDRQLPVEMHYAHTDDGYWIPVVRIPAKDQDAPGEYFDYSIDELGLQDIKAADRVVTNVVTKELSKALGDSSKPAFEHIKLVHSMAGAAVMIYLTDCLVKGEAHGISQVIAAGPAGFQRPKGLLGAGSQILRLLLRIPPQWQTITAFPIGLTEETLISEPIFKALYDVTSLKPLDKVARYALRTLLAGDTSKWADAIRREHYNPAGMPVVTWKILLHLLQQIKSGRFTRFDHGKQKNEVEYQDEDPRDVTALYDLLDVRLNLVAGGKDSIVSTKAVQKHVNAVLKANERRAARGDAPIDWTFEVLEGLGHLDIIDGDNPTTVAALRKHWQRAYT